MTDNVELPSTIEESLEILLEDLSLTEKKEIAELAKNDLSGLHFSLGQFIRNKFELWEDNNELTKFCCKTSGTKEMHPDSVSSMIIKALWQRLQVLNKIRIIN